MSRIRTALIVAALVPLTTILILSPFVRVVPFLLYFGAFALFAGAR